MGRKPVRSYERVDPRTGRTVKVAGHMRSSSGDGRLGKPAAGMDAMSDGEPFDSSDGRRRVDVHVERVAAEVSAGAADVARAGNWPERISLESLSARIPPVDGVGPGVDGGVLAACGRIPADRAGLTAKMHAAYTPETVAQVRREMGLDGSGGQVDADSESVWWLAACSVCREGQVDRDGFVAQLHEFDMIAADPDLRVARARWMLNDMLSAYEVRDGVPVALRDGGMQGAYLDGHDVAVHHAEHYGIWFVGTFHRSLGLDDFEWKSPANPDGVTDDERRGRSGPVFGSAQFVKAADEDEMRAVMDAVRVEKG